MVSQTIGATSNAYPNGETASGSVVCDSEIKQLDWRKVDFDHRVIDVDESIEWGFIHAMSEGVISTFRCCLGRSRE